VQVQRKIAPATDSQQTEPVEFEHSAAGGECSLTFGNGRDHEDVDECGAVTLTHQGDLVGVTAEHPDVLLDPVQRSDDVQESVVARSVAVLRAQKTFHNTPAPSTRLI